MDKEKLIESIELLKLALTTHQKHPKDRLYKAALSKAFETAFEYIWKLFKAQANSAGYEAYSPRDAIKAALEMKLISGSSKWETYLSQRNLSVHDYIGVDAEEFTEVVEGFLRDISKVKI